MLFQCLVYLHRYNEGTLARMRTEYVIPLQGQIAARIEQLEADKAKATSTSHRNKLQKEQTDLRKQQTELLIFEEKLKHIADQKITLDLDDGVKVNYAKFGDLLAESKAITGERTTNEPTSESNQYRTGNASSTTKDSASSSGTTPNGSFKSILYRSSSSKV